MQSDCNAFAKRKKAIARKKCERNAKPKPQHPITKLSLLHRSLTQLTSKGGFRALYRGLGPNLVGVTPEKAIKLAVNEFIREKLEAEDGSITIASEVCNSHHSLYLAYFTGSDREQ
jgi:hypothetical protein